MMLNTIYWIVWAILMGLYVTFVMILPVKEQIKKAFSKKLKINIQIKGNRNFQEAISYFEKPYKVKKWNHIVITKDGLNYTYYKNKKQVPKSKIENPYRITIEDVIEYDRQKHEKLLNRFMKQFPSFKAHIIGFKEGDLNDVRIYNRNLNENETDALYENGIQSKVLTGEGK